MAAQTVSAVVPFLFACADETEDCVAQPSPVVDFTREPELDPELSVYRKRTIALLRRYLQFSIETGRLPSLVGREFFRSNTSYIRPHTFEDGVHFVIDVERCLERLEPLLQQLIVKVVLQEYTEEDAAVLLRCGLRTVERRLPEAIDRVTEMFLARKILVSR